MTTESKPRIAIYGRHSSAKQTVTSSLDQATACQKVVDYVGGTVVGIYLDPEISGYRRDRPGLKRLLADVRAGKIDLVVSEALDRLARDAEDVAWLGKKLKFGRVRIHTVGEGEIDEIKLAVAGLLGTIFISQLRNKTLRGMAAAVAAGRFAGGRSYGYQRVVDFDAKGELVRGLLRIDPVTQSTVLRIFAEFSAGHSAIQIATRLNNDGIPGPRGGQWNASTIHGDPKKHVGILNNPLYVGKLIWNRREWRRDPDSDKRERRYRLREESEWVEVSVPDLRIVPDTLHAAVRRQLEARMRPSKGTGLHAANRKRHLLSGLIKCGSCGSNYIISGKDYYRCAGQKERGTCDNKVSVRTVPLERLTLSVLERRLLTAEHAHIYVEEFQKEAARLRAVRPENDTAVTTRLEEIQIAIDNLAQNMLAGVISSTLSLLLTKLEAEREDLQVRIAASARPASIAPVLSHSDILLRFEDKIAHLVDALGDEAIRQEATTIVQSLIESVTVYPDCEDGPEAEVVASVGTLMSFASNENTRPGLGQDGCSVAVVAGTGFDLCRTRIPLPLMQGVKSR